MDHPNRPHEEPEPHARTAPPVVAPSTTLGPRQWQVQEWIGENLVELGVVEAVHQPNALMRAYTKYRIFDTDRQSRIAVAAYPIGQGPNPA